MSRIALTAVVVLTLGSFACGLSLKSFPHIDEEGSLTDISKETAGVFAEFDKNGDKKLDIAEYRAFRKKEGDQEDVLDAEFKELAMLADPDHEHGALALTMDDFQTLVNTETIDGSKIVPSKEALLSERKDWLNTRQWRHKSFSDKVKDAMVEKGDAMVEEIFEAYDENKDEMLALSEFNKLQTATEGKQGTYTDEQFKEFLDQADPNRDQEALSFDMLKNMYLDSDYSAEFQTELPGDYEALLKIGSISGNAVNEK